MTASVKFVSMPTEIARAYQAIPDVYGYRRVWPDLIQPSLVEYVFNEEGNLAEADQGGRQHPAISIVHVEGDLFFASADLFRTQIQGSCTDPNLRIVILRLKNARHLDATCAMAIEELVRTLRADGRYADGAPVTAADFVHAFERALDPATAAPSAPTSSWAMAQAS